MQKNLINKGFQTVDKTAVNSNVGASMSSADLELWDKEHIDMLERVAPESFSVTHYISIAELQIKSNCGGL